MAGLTIANKSSAAYTKAEKILSRPSPTVETKLETPPIHSAALATHTFAHRDPYQGFTQMFSMPGSRTAIQRDNNSGRPTVHSDQKPVNRSAMIGDILKDRSQQSRIVDNVMNFFKYKDPERYGGGGGSSG